MGGLPDQTRRRRDVPLPFALRAAAMAALLIVPAIASAAPPCGVASGDFCVCCPPSDCRREADYCPGGAGGLIVLETANPSCAVTRFDAARCKSGGVIASEMRSAVGVHTQGQTARIDLTPAQLAELVEQLSALRQARGR